VQCALLHDGLGWSYERLAELHGWTDATRASKYVRDGRVILQDSLAKTPRRFSLLKFYA
jgi:hypothetical protein